jgi:hypothetical protein
VATDGAEPYGSAGLKSEVRIPKSEGEHPRAFSGAFFTPAARTDVRMSAFGLLSEFADSDFKVPEFN